MRLDLDPKSDLRWSAFLYVAGELGPAEVDRWEARLLDDQAAREAVAEAVGLIAAVRAVAPDPIGFVLPRRDRRRWRGSVATLAVAAGVLAAVALPRGLGSFSNSRSTPPDTPPLDAVEVAQAWSDLRDDPAGPVSDAPGADAVEGDDDPEPADRAMPSWLVAAAAARADATAEPETPMDEED